jgi:hypothetical protein
MRYRMEFANNQPVVRNVETSVIVGRVFWLDVPDPDDPSRICRVLAPDGEFIANLRLNADPFSDPYSGPMSTAISAAALREEIAGFPNFKHIEEADGPVELTLGVLMADAAQLLARALAEYEGAGLKDDTKQQFVKLLMALVDIKRVSNFGSYNGEIGLMEPYFSSGPSPYERMQFSDAAQYFGLIRLQSRLLPLGDAVDEPALKVILGWVIELVQELEREATRPDLPLH